MVPIFITGIGTDIGKTVVAAIVTRALEANYWKPVQAGFDQGTDSQWVAERIANPNPHGGMHPRTYPETYKLALPASPHIAARKEGLNIDLDRIVEDLHHFTRQGSSSLSQTSPSTNPTPPSTHHSTPPPSSQFLIIEGAGGLFVPLNEKEFVIDLIKKIGGPVILVSRNYLGSINHSLMTAALCKTHQIPVAGWIFNDQYLHYEDEIVQWTGLPSIGSIPHYPNPDAEFIAGQAEKIRASMLRHLQPWLG